ncbi:MAG: hypothetical protein AAF552_12155, partial [Pseudomonadota bacterium]
MSNHPVAGAGLGLRRALLGPLRSHASETQAADVHPVFWSNFPEIHRRIGLSFAGVGTQRAQEGPPQP